MGPRPGDEIVVNDPFAGGTHLNDITVVAPCFVGNELVGWVANRAHHADVGGIAPGSMPPDATEIAEEGLRMAPTRLDDELVELIATSSRTPVERRGDLDAQRGANRLGVARMATVVAALGSAAPLAEVVDYGERRMRAALARASRRSLACRRRARLRGATPRAAVTDARRSHAHRRRRARGVRLHRYRRAAGGQRQRSGSGDDQRGRVRDPRRDRFDDARERWRDAAGHRDHAAGHGGRGSPTGRGRRGQRRGEPARRRRVSRGARASGSRSGRRRRPGHDEQRADRW